MGTRRDLLALLLEVRPYIRAPGDRVANLRHAYEAIEAFAADHFFNQDWCDQFLLALLDPPWLMREDSFPTDLLFLKLEGTELTREEVRVLRLLARGHTIAETAEILGKGSETVKSQARVARGRLGARNTTHAVAIAISLDLI